MRVFSDFASLLRVAVRLFAAGIVREQVTCMMMRWVWHVDKVWRCKHRALMAGKMIMKWIVVRSL